MSNTEIPIAAVRRKSSRAAFITAAGFLIIVAAIGVSIWQIHKLQNTARTLSAQIETLDTQIEQLNATKAATAATLNTLMRARELILSGAASDLSQAAEVVNGVLRETPGDAAAQSMLAEISYRQNSFTDAVAMMRLAVAADTANLLEYRVRLITYLCATGASEDLSAARTMVRDADTASRLAQDPRLGAGNSALRTHCAPLGADLANAISPVVERAPSTESEDLFDVRQVFLHIRSEQDRARAIEIARGLCEAGYFMPGIQVIGEPRAYPEQGSVRYYYPVQETEAGRVAQTARAAAQQSGVNAWAQLGAPQVLSGFSDLPGDRIEVWLPPLTAAAAETDAPGRRGFTCTPLVRVAAPFNGLTAAESAQRQAARADLARALTEYADGRLNAALIEVMASASGATAYQVRIGGANALSRMRGPIPVNNRTRALTQLRAMRADADNQTLQENLDAAIVIVAAD